MRSAAIFALRPSTLAAAAALLASLGAQAGVVWSGNGHEYAYVDAANLTWTAARASALGLGDGWDLATLGSADEDAFVRSLLPAGPERSHVWLGGTDAAAEGDWRWVSGEGFGFTHWWGGEPNNAGNEDYLAMDLRGMYAWNDAPNAMGAAGYNMLRGYVIERDATSVPEPGTIALVGLALLGAAGARRRRRG